MIRRTFCPEDGRACYTPKSDEPVGFRCANYILCKSFEPLAQEMAGEAPRPKGSGPFQDRQARSPTAMRPTTTGVTIMGDVAGLIADDDHEHIWLQPKCCGEHEFNGRQWCQDEVWEECDCPEPRQATKYVRADLAATVL